MSTSWSEMILQFLYDGYNKEEIIQYFNHPIVNAEYIDTVSDCQRRLLRKHYNARYTPRSIPPTGTQQRIVYDYAMSLGGIAQFEELLKTRTQISICKELGVKENIVKNFVRDRIRGRKSPPWMKGYFNLTRKLFMEGTLKSRPKRIPLKDVRKLW